MAYDERNNVARCPKCNEKLEWLSQKCFQCKDDALGGNLE